jgi:dihydroorotate dehydrogenase electron transfer subunit
MKHNSASCLEGEVSANRVLWREDGRVRVFRLDLELARNLGDHVPGQFVMLRAPEKFGLERPWGRAFSILEARGRRLSLLIQACGSGTRLLASSAPGEPVVVWGPLGNGFSRTPGAPALLLGGGIGLAPLACLAGRDPDPDSLHLCFGHRLPAGAFPLDAFSSIGRVETYHERRPGDLEKFLARLEELVTRAAGDILACGPAPFLAAVQRAAASVGKAAQLSLENRMACGVGACLGCVVEHATEGPVQSCTRGPVFCSHELESGAG